MANPRRLRQVFYPPPHSPIRRGLGVQATKVGVGLWRNQGVANGGSGAERLSCGSSESSVGRAQPWRGPSWRDSPSTGGTDGISGPRRPSDTPPQMVPSPNPLRQRRPASRSGSSPTGIAVRASRPTRPTARTPHHCDAPRTGWSLSRVTPPRVRWPPPPGHADQRLRPRI